jgi:hypothetical protein
MRRPTTLRAVLLVTAILAAGCGDDDPLPTEPTPPQQVTETIEGTLTPFSARNHGFQVLNPGIVTATLTAIEQPNPEPTTVGLDIGTMIGNTCQVVVSNNRVTQALAVTATATAAGTLCVRIYDTYDAGLPSPVQYTITVVHF